ncbi:hypothetical protein ABK040_012005 [Willaertia magna]
MRDSATAYILWLGCCLGLCGLHRFYLDSPVLGIIYLFTGGLCGIGQLLDLILIPGMVEDLNRREGMGSVSVTTVTTTGYTQPVSTQPYYQYPNQGYVPPQTMNQGYVPNQNYIPPNQGYVPPPQFGGYY